jgi:trk system potassium uptake protein TrkH
MRLKHGMVISSLAWIWAGIVGAGIMMMCLDISFANAFFENMSAWTGSGLTIFNNVEVLPMSILFLRSYEQWLGGLGVVIIFIGVLIRNGTAASRLYESEARDDRIKPSIINTLYKTVEIYTLYTVLGILMYIVVGMPLFDSINATFTTISTGGMSIKNANIGAYHSDAINIVTIIIMIIGSISFSVHYKVVKTKGLAILKDVQFQAIMALIIISTIAIYFTSHLRLLDIIFQVVSAISTTGANVPSSSVLSLWPSFSLLIIIVLMLIGGSSGSTVGSIKVIRVITFLKGINLTTLNLLSPEGRVIGVKIGGKTIQEKEIRESSAYIALFLVFVLISWLVLLVYGYDPLYSLFNVISAQGNNGVWIGSTCSLLPDELKYLLVGNMWIGRLEIIPVLVLVRSLYETLKRIPRQIKGPNKPQFK